MWVVNQDGIAVVHTDALAIDPADIQHANGVRLWASTADHDYVMGMYGSVDEAIEVLSEFRTAILKGQKTFMCPKAKPIESKEVN